MKCDFTNIPIKWNDKTDKDCSQKEIVYVSGDSITNTVTLRQGNNIVVLGTGMLDLLCKELYRRDVLCVFIGRKDL